MSDVGIKNTFREYCSRPELIPVVNVNKSKVKTSNLEQS